VTVPTTAGRTAPAGVRLHRAGTLGPQDTRRLGALRVTSPERTLEDLAAHVSPTRLGRAIDEAEARGLLTRPLRTAHLPGAAALRAAMDGRRVTRSDLEAGSSRSWPAPGCRARARTSSSARTPSTSCSPTTRSSSSSTASLTIGPARASRRTAPATGA
jgi:hypothetical protein